jgi:hypothetical protein
MNSCSHIALLFTLAMVSGCGVKTANSDISIAFFESHKDLALHVLNDCVGSPQNTMIIANREKCNNVAIAIGTKNKRQENQLHELQGIR